MTRIDVDTVLEPSPATWVRVCGPLSERSDVTALHEAVGLLPLNATIVVELDHQAELGARGAEGLTELAVRVSTDHGRLIIVAGDIDQRARLVLAEVDHRATLLHSREQVDQLLGYAA